MREEEDRAFQLKLDKKKDDASRARLLELNTWMEDRRRRMRGAQANGYVAAQVLSTDDVLKIVQWKLSIGTWRPRLLDLVKSNSDSLIQDCLRRAHTSLSSSATSFNIDKLMTSITILTELKGVGPATASAILSVCYDFVPFMSDEVMTEVGLVPLKYTTSVYKSLVEKLIHLYDAENSVEDSKVKENHDRLRPLSDFERLVWAKQVILSTAFSTTISTTRKRKRK